MALDVAIVGAGPYGLAAAEALHRRGLAVRTFGEPMQAWRRHMPRGMLLRSSWEACHIGSPAGPMGLDAYERELGRRFEGPVPLEHFVSYGLWFDRRSGHTSDPRFAARVERGEAGFKIHLDDGDQLEAAGVIVAAGIQPFAHRPLPFESLPSKVISHAYDNSDLSIFAGRRVLVVGGGQSALESAALLTEAGAETEVVARGEELRWVRGAPCAGGSARSGRWSTPGRMSGPRASTISSRIHAC